MPTYEVVRNYHTPHVWTVPCGRFTDRNAAQVWRDRLRHIHKDVRRGRCNVGIRKVGGDV